VIVNCRNSEGFLRQCLGSIKNQTYSDYEVIIWDNKSTDSTFQIASKFSETDNRFKVFQGATFLKLGEARNMAIQEARGKFIAFLDSDDLWDPNFLTDHFKALGQWEERVFGIGNVTEIDSNFNLLQVSAKDASTEVTLPPRNIYKKLLKGNTIYFSSLVIPSNFFIQNAGFKGDYVQAEDYEMLLRASQMMKCYKTGLAYYRIHDGNATSVQQDALFTESLQILESHSNHLWGWITFKLTAARYFLYLNNPTYGQRLDRLKTLSVGRVDLLIGAIILGVVTIRSELFGKKAS
jgi:glycosyltransferase involved in cell wall biosynthesis